MNGWKRLLAKRALDRELDAEMAAHRAEAIDAAMDDGMDEAEARVFVARRFGSSTLGIKEDSRDAWGWVRAEQIGRDIRYGCRILSRDRSFSLTVVIILALSIGMNTAVFSLLKGVLLTSLPYRQPDELVQLWQTNKSGQFMHVSGPDFRDWRKQTHVLGSLASFDSGKGAFSGSGFTPRRIRMGIVSAGFFETLGVQAALGHVFNAEEQRPGGTPAILLGSGLASDVFGSAPSALGRMVRLDGLAFVVSGILPRSFDFPAAAQAWIPGDYFGDETARSAHNFQVLGRLRSGRTVAEAQAEMNVIADRLGRTYIDDRGEGIRVEQLYQTLTAPVRPALLTLFGAVSLLLLIACVNISNLQLTRTTTRLREFALRSAVGAARRRLAAQLLIESFLLSGAGGLAGLLVAVVGTHALKLFAPADMPLLDSIRIDPSMLAFTALVAIATALGFGFLPALAGSRVDLSETLKKGQTQSTAAPGFMRWARALVVMQVMFAVAMTSGACLLIKSYWKLSHVPTGLATERVIMADLSWPTADGNRANVPEVSRIACGLLSALRADRKIEAAALVHPLPIRDSAPDGDFEIAGRASPPDPHDAFNAIYRIVSPAYLQVFRVPLLRGRAFTTYDDNSPAQVAIVNQSFARTFFPHTDVLGQRIRFFGFDRKPQFLTIIGLVPDTRTLGLDARVYPEVLGNFFQHTESVLDSALVIRSSADVVPSVFAALHKLSPNTPLKFEAMHDVITGTIARERFQTFLLGLFAGLALLLASVGILGLLSYAVSRRRNELGIRIAVGASRLDVLRLVMAEGGRMVGVGLLLGLFLTVASSRVLSRFLYAVPANDFGALTGAVFCFVLAAFIACYMPAMRASRLDALAAIRHD